jgi:hypothetical protein
MHQVTAQAIAEQVSEKILAIGPSYPPRSRTLEASLHIGARVPRLVRARAFHPAYTE